MNVIFTCGGTAGHVNPALALAGRVGRREPSVRLLLLGRARGMGGDCDRFVGREPRRGGP